MSCDTIRCTLEFLGVILVLKVFYKDVVMNWYLAALKKYVDFNGRARRKEYWYFTLFNVIFILICSAIDNHFGWMYSHTSDLYAYNLGFLTIAYYLATILPALAVSVRRLHDTDRTGWWILIGLIPLIGTIVLIIFFVIDSKPGTNKYGPNPKGIISLP